MKLSRTTGIILLIAFNIAIDQISKVIARANIDPTERINVVGDFFILMNVENEGAFLGMGSTMNPTLKLIFLLVVPVIVLGYLIYYIIKNKEMDKWSTIALSCIAGGGIANVFDRIAYGSVTDFFYLHINDTLKTGIFNVADMSVTFGMIILLLAAFFVKKKKVETA
ncbi:signal peptidase II [Psychroserpens sp.]|uniref:signal peptidase II n=1 Tax=Psychroserpens sp. TaxID=2020870 RepID=UPI001B237F77|nr:signal peptidase II [Psychroserpens sp.]MBO6607898.1 signal peptidase II [Psychroserpens sp.]MBO6631817.1 signal peptidase II [Psychroserpens sp.]MBO6654975.1 signal peptidase II [Psychroserpens sp.]MBO6682951.1 signal peptidase II [Psychroserpens sp.]MBO6751256.1 signal peptidase II [Psychroserpens sp.]